MPLLSSMRFDRLRALRSFPNRGRVVPEVGDESLRELFVKSYRLIYEIQREHVVILALIYGVRRLPTDLA